MALRCQETVSMAFGGDQYSRSPALSPLDRVVPKSVVRVTFSILDAFGFFLGVGERTPDPGMGKEDDDDDDEAPT